MRKQQKRIQIILVSIGFLLIAITYFYYPYLKKLDLIKDQSSVPVIVDAGVGTVRVVLAFDLLIMRGCIPL